MRVSRLDVTLVFIIDVHRWLRISGWVATKSSLRAQLMTLLKFEINNQSIKFEKRDKIKCLPCYALMFEGCVSERCQPFATKMSSFIIANPLWCDGCFHNQTKYWVSPRSLPSISSTGHGLMGQVIVDTFKLEHCSPVSAYHQCRLRFANRLSCLMETCVYCLR